LNHYLLKSFIISYILLWGQTIVPSVLASTLIKKVYESTPVEQIIIGDFFVGYSNKELINVSVTNVIITTTNTITAITTNKGTIHAAPDQLFYDPVNGQWIKAKNITTNTSLLDFNGNHCPCLNVQTISAKPTHVYHISTTDPHTFFVYDQELLTHNFVPIFIALSWLFGGGIEFLGATIGTAVLGTIAGIHIYKNRDNSSTQFTISPQMGGTCGGYNPDPDDDEKNERKFNTTSKSEFFKKVKNDYEHWRDGIYKRKRGAKGIENAEYIQWDHLHSDVEAYAVNRQHLGSINPRTLKLYKPAIYPRKVPR